MARNESKGQKLDEPLDQAPQGRVLRIFKRHLARSFDFNPNRKIVAGVSTPKVRESRVPGPIVDRDVLTDFAVAANEKMRRNAQVPYLVGVPLAPRARKEPVDAFALEHPRGKGNVVKNE